MTLSNKHRLGPFSQALLTLQTGLLLRWPHEAQAAKAACSFAAAEGGDQVRMIFNSSRGGRRTSDFPSKQMDDNELWKEMGEVVVVIHNLQSSEEELDFRIRENQKNQSELSKQFDDRMDAMQAILQKKAVVDRELEQTKEGFRSMTAGMR